MGSSIFEFVVKWIMNLGGRIKEMLGIAPAPTREQLIARGSTEGASDSAKMIAEILICDETITAKRAIEDGLVAVRSYLR